ncbi:MAG: Mobile element protein, partial [Olavius algarvensis Gamma 3 endosymbiont]
RRGEEGATEGQDRQGGLGDQSYPEAVPHRVGDQESRIGGKAASAPRAGATVARSVQGMARQIREPGAAEDGARQSHCLHAGPMEKARALSRRWPPQHRQQPGGARGETLRDRSQELDVLEHRQWRQGQRDALQYHRD